MGKDDRILITGGSGVVGYALLKVLRENGYKNIVSISSKDYDLTVYERTLELFAKYKPVYVFHLAGRVYGIMGNMKNKSLSYIDNIRINTNVLEAARIVNVKKIIAMSTGAVYPYPPKRLPLKEEDMWEGYPHPSEDTYAIAKRVMDVQLRAYNKEYGLEYAYVISSNLYGPHDRFNEHFGHVIPSLISKFYRAKLKGDDVVVWGDGSARRDFLFSYDAAKALLLIMEKFKGEINLGSGVVYSIKEVVDTLSKITGVTNIKWDRTKPNGQEYRAYDLSKLNSIGFKPQYPLEKGLKITWDWFCENQDRIRN